MILNKCFGSSHKWHRVQQHQHKGQRHTQRYRRWSENNFMLSFDYLTSLRVDHLLMYTSLFVYCLSIACSSRCTPRLFIFNLVTFAFSPLFCEYGDEKSVERKHFHSSWLAKAIFWLFFFLSHSLFYLSTYEWIFPQKTKKKETKRQAQTWRPSNHQNNRSQSLTGDK